MPHSLEGARYDRGVAAPKVVGDAVSLRFKGISHAYGPVSVLSELDFDVKAGEITCLLGPSGGGKSTLLRLAAGLEPLQAGRIEIDGRVVATPETTEPPERRPIGMMFQDNALFPHLSVAENVGFGLGRWPKSKRRARVRALLEMVGCGGLADRLPHQLSGGQQQRVALVRSLAPEPQVLLMDEPYASVDIGLRRALREAARRTLKRDGTTTIMVTHDPSEAMEMADVIAVLDEGHIVQTGSPKQLYEAPLAPSVAALFGDAQRVAVRPSPAGFDTEFGPIADTETKPEDRVSACEVVVRPSGLRLVPDAEGRAQIVDIRYVGDGWLAFVLPEATDVNTTPLRVSVDGRQVWSIADRVALQRAPSGFFVFPESSSRDEGPGTEQ